MLSTPNLTLISSFFQYERVSNVLYGLKEHVEYLSKSIQEVNIELSQVTKRIKELEEAINATK